MARAGTVVDGRFEIERLAGRGGMGEVFRARDLTTSGTIALKILRDEASADHRERFAREARVLAELTHPAVVRYIAFGKTDEEKPYLAMEWLEGEDLAARLRRNGVSAADGVKIASRTAAALGAAHALGVVHRDIKPSNLFLVDRDPDRVKVLDFGIARIQQADDGMTRTGAAIGTPKYMAPEQARGSRDLDARADVFSLGCVLFECLAGCAPFAGSSPAAIFAKILLEEAPRLGDVRGDLPSELEDLVARMLSKDPLRRPRDGTAAAADLDAIGELADVSHRARRATDSGVTTGEQRLVCVVFVASAIDFVYDAATTPITMPDAPHASMPSNAVPTRTIDLPSGKSPSTSSLVQRLSKVVAEHRGRSEILADGSVVVSLYGSGAATDQAARAARCALAIRAVIPDAPMAFAIGRSSAGQHNPIGEVIDRAIGLVPRAGSAIRVDDVSAGLLDVRFVIEGDDDRVLVGERDVATISRTLLGKPIPCIGRERELASLTAIFEECVAEPMAHVVVVTSPAGVGKSRLRFELVQRLAPRGVEIWIGRGDPMSAGAPFAMLGQAIRRAAGIVDDEPLATRWRKLEGRIARHVAAEHVARITEFLGELVGAPSLEPEVGMQLTAARHSPQLMGDQMLRACEELLAAECAVHPVLLVLEDLQWSDLPTVQFIDAIARRLADQPLMVLALGRPEIDVVFPRLWSARGVERIQLGDLTKRAADKLVRAALDDVSPELVERLVEHAAGNAFYLEELIRSVAEGHGDRLPETVVAMMQARIESLEPEARHILRAASVFGQVFWRSGVGALLEGGSATDVHDWLDELVRRELLTARRESRFGGETEFTFRHSLVREAAYAMLTDRDRLVGHKLAGEWLEARIGTQQDVEAVALAEHFLRGGELGRSIGWYRQAAQHALEGDDLVNAIERAERAIACVHAVGDTDSPADSAVVGELRQLQAGAHDWRGEYALAAERGDEAMERLPPSRREWLVAAAAVANARARGLEHGRVIALCKKLVETPLSEELHRDFTHAAAMTMTTLLWHGDRELVDQLFARLDHIEAASSDDQVTLAWIYSARAWRALREGDHAESLRLDAKCEACFTAVGDLRHACQQHANVGYGELMLGSYAAAEHALLEAIANATRIGLHQVTSQAKHNLGLALARQGRIAEGRTVEGEALAAFEEQGNRRLAAGAHNYLGLIEIAAGRYANAIAHARAAIDAATDKPGVLSAYRGTLSRALRLDGDASAALVEAATGIALVEAHGRPEEGEYGLRLAHAEALRATGDIDGARRAITEAKARLLEEASRIADTDRRRSYLESVEENASIIALAATIG